MIKQTTAIFREIEEDYKRYNDIKHGKELKMKCINDTCERLIRMKLVSMILFLKLRFLFYVR